MICTRHWSAAIKVCTVLVIGLSGAPAFARFITMPTTARTWLDIRGNAGVEIDANGFPVNDSIGQFFASENSIPLAEYDAILPLMVGNRVPGLHIFAAGSADGNALKSFVSGEDNATLVPNVIPNISMFNSSRDTYTLTGTPAQVGLSVILTAYFDIDGTTSLFGASNGNAVRVGQVDVIAKMGTFDTGNIGSREDLRVTPFDASTNATYRLVRNGNVALASDAIDLHISHTFTAIIGTPFDIAYGLNLSAFDAFGSTATPIHGFIVDLSHTAAISFDVPNGLALTSVLGFSSPVTEPTGAAVPEPSSFLLFGLGFIGLLACRRKSSAPGLRIPASKSDKKS